MSLRDKLLALRVAAHSFSETPNPSEFLSLVREGHPYDQLFFSELSDSQWLPLLKQAGYFSRLPSREVNAEGWVSYPRHLPLYGLKRIAQTAPQQAAQILEELQVANNPAVADQIMMVIAAIGESALARRLFFVLRRIVRTGGALSFLGLDDILTRWLRSGEVDVSIDTIELYFAAAVSNAEHNQVVARGGGLYRLDQQVVAKLSEKEPFAVAEVVFSVLRTWAANERNKNESTRAKEPQTGGA